MSFTLNEIAAKIGGTIDGDGSVIITDAAPIETAGPTEISFVANPRYRKHIANTKAGALVLDLETDSEGRAVLRHEKPYLIFAMIIDLLYPDEQTIKYGIDKSAVVSKKTNISTEAAVGPLCHLSDSVQIGAGTVLLSSVYVGKDVTIGENCRLYPGVCIMDGTRIGNNVRIHASTVIGSDGFGYAESDTGLKKIKQIGWVEIDDDVEIGSNCSVDRGALGPTKIGRGTKIDNLVQIAHNVEIGQHSIIVSQVGISGSTTIGNGVILAGQVGVVGHLEIGDGVLVGAQSGVAHSVKAGEKVFGSPARPIMASKRIEACLTRLPDLIKRVRTIETILKDDLS